MKCKATQYVCFQSSVIGERLDLPYFLAPPPRLAAPISYVKNQLRSVNIDPEAKNTEKCFITIGCTMNTV